MTHRNFDQWLSTFRETIATYAYYVDFDKVYEHVDEIKIELNMLNALIGSQNIEAEFETLVAKYPEVLRCIPILLAKRGTEIVVTDCGGELRYQFEQPNYSVEQYTSFMRKSGLFDMMQNHLIHSLVDYVTGVEGGLDSNGRKNRGGDLMENLGEGFLVQAGFVKDKTYFKEMSSREIEMRWGLDLSAISNLGTVIKRFDFVVRGAGKTYGVETNFYTGGGSKLNETARSYKTLAMESANLKNFEFVWFTDGQGWKTAKNNLRETFEVLDNLYNIKELEEGVAQKIFV